MPFKWIQSKFRDLTRKENEEELVGPSDETLPPVRPHQPTATVFGPVPWTIWFDCGLELVCEDGRDRGRVIPVKNAFLVLGRGVATADEPRDGWLLFTEETVSRRQAILCWNEDRDNFFLYHLHGATNPTCVDRKSGGQWRVGAGSAIEMGYLRLRIQSKIGTADLSPFVRDALERLGASVENRAVKTGFALTVINGERKGDTLLLSRRFHVLHRTPADSGLGLLELGDDPSLEQDMLLWNDDAQGYMLVHNPRAKGPTFVHAGRPPHGPAIDMFAPIQDVGIEVFSGSPITLCEGDTLRIGGLHVRLHRNIQPLLEGTIEHILQKGYIEKIPAVDVMLANAFPSPLEAPPAYFDGRGVAAYQSEAAPPPLRDTSLGRGRPSPGSGRFADQSSPLPSAETARKLGVGPLPKAPSPAASGDVSAEAGMFDSIEEAPPPPPPAAPPRPPAVQPAPIFSPPPRKPREKPLPEVIELPPHASSPAFSHQREIATSSAPTSAPRAVTPIRRYALEAIAWQGIAPGTHVQVFGEAWVDVDAHARVVIGSSDACDVHLPADKAIAPCHAALQGAEGSLLLCPLNGHPIVNGTICLKEVPLRDGDEVRLSRVSAFRLRVDG